MSIEIDKDKQQIKFHGDKLLTLEYELLELCEIEGELVRATWKCDKYPVASGDIAYFLYEDVPYFTKSKYHYWVYDDKAGLFSKGRKTI